jgi:hypothetical protein
MPTYNGISYPETDFLDYGYKTTVTSGTGVSLPRWQAALCDAIADAGKQMRTTSVSSVAVGTGTKTFVNVTDLPYQAGDVVRVTDTSNSANYMYGTVTSYTSATKTLIMTVASGDTGGSGTITSWNVAVAGLKGPTGATGAAGSNGSNGTNGTNGADAHKYATVGGTANALTLTCSPALGSLTVGQPIYFLAGSANTTAVTINVDGIGVKNARVNGAALTGGEFVAGVMYIAEWDGTNIQILNTGSGASGVYVYNAVASSSTAQTLDFTAYKAHDITLTANCTFTFTLPTVASGKENEYILILRQNGTGGYTITWPTNGTITLWSGTTNSSTPPSLNTQANSITVVRLKQVAASTAVVATVEGTNTGSSTGNIATAGLFLVGGAANKVNKSSDGATFSASTPAGSDNVVDIIYSSVFSKFFLVNDNGTGTPATAIQYSTNGTSWSAATGASGWNNFATQPTNLVGVKFFNFSNGNVMLVDCGAAASTNVQISTNGTAFANLSMGANSVKQRNGIAVQANNALVLHTNIAGQFSYTTDGGATATTGLTHTGVAVSSSCCVVNGNFVVSGTTGNLGYKTSVSATALTSITSNLASAIMQGGLWDGTGYLFWTAGSLSTATTIAGTYTSRTTAFFTTAGMTGNIVDIATNGSTVILAATDTGDIARSTDHGATWTKIASGSNFMSGTQIRFLKYLNSNFWLGSDAGKLGYTTDGLAITQTATTGFSTNAVTSMGAG